jgi:hypothetical protein
MFEIPFPSERFIEDYVQNRIERDRVCPISGEGVDHLLRQHEIKAYGRTDIIKLMVSPGLLEIVILELKNESLSEVHLSQLARYLVGMNWQAQRYRARFPGYEIMVRGELAGPFDASANDLVWMVPCLRYVDIYGLSADLEEGFTSTRIGTGWHKRDEDLKGGRKIARLVGGEIFALEEAVAAAAEETQKALEGAR